MKEARAVIARLDRIEAMELTQEPVALLLNELELLLPEVGRWLEQEGPAAIAARVALERCLFALEGGTNASRRLRRSGCVTVAREEHSLGCLCVERKVETRASRSLG